MLNASASTSISPVLPPAAVEKEKFKKKRKETLRPDFQGLKYTSSVRPDIVVWILRYGY
jgi:hypothetical protein